MIAPGYYWIRWPDYRGDASFRAWQPSYVSAVRDAAQVTGSDQWHSLHGAELGPRIEPPRAPDPLVEARVGKDTYGTLRRGVPCPDCGGLGNCDFCGGRNPR